MIDREMFEKALNRELSACDLKGSGRIFQRNELDRTNQSSFTASVEFQLRSSPSGAELEILITEDGEIIFPWSYPEFEGITGKRFCG